MLGAAVLVVLAVAGVTVALLLPGGARAARSRARGRGAAAGSAPPAVAAPPGGARAGPRAAGPGEPAGSGPTPADRQRRVQADGTSSWPPTAAPQPPCTPTTNTRVHGAGQRAPADLPPGDRAVVRVSGTGDTATAVSGPSPQTRVTGTVTALTGDTSTVQQGNGLSCR